ncbi:ABC transporter ATP-binding protein [Sphingobacterium pedocola]|uniref:Multidrug ABC transporter ATP-binding protein n=1 Tax=Sphingobacterium pedocola TaxID=2082722 RepID=A0ABR9TBG6_9SPHI|nr:ABC transporter ATP-binding protein [Sphingobacterium pedocola]MBE8722646.1 multidrug ABC transporter ATP-binding protein [Sphingobacterium pedocola]
MTTNEDTPIVQVVNLSHRYNVQWAIRDINFELRKNGIYGLLGANGAGKSTTMNIMCGVLNQSGGEVLIRGINMAEHPVQAKKHIGFLPQQPPLLPELTVEEYLIHTANLRLMPAEKIPEALDKVLAKCNIAHFRKRLLKNLSGGYQQRVGIAQAIIHEPDFVVLDEPTNGLDPNQILDVRHLIREIAQERTVVLSTHILQEVQALCDHIWMIHEGRMVFSGSLEQFDSQVAPNSVVVSMISPPLTEELHKLPGVVDVEPLGSVKFRIRSTNTQELVQQLVERSVQEKWNLIEIYSEKSSLETVFAEMTKKKRKA